MKPVLFFLFVACSSRTKHATASAESEVTGAVEVPNQTPEQDIARVEAFHATRPVYERPLELGTKVPSGVPSLSAESCGICHQQIYREWKVSTHAAAWHDPQYQQEIQKSGNRWLCLNCHTPLLTQQDKWPVGLVDGDVERPELITNPVYDEKLREEGITCAACHVRDGVIHGPGLDGNAPHPVVADPDYRSGALCQRCHQAVATYPGKQFTCTFKTGEEWEAGPYRAEGRSCPDCHMPSVERAVMEGGPKKRVGQHYWRGAGIPKVAGVYPPREANPPGLGLVVETSAEQLHIEATNKGAGHMLPTGDPERWVQVSVTFYATDTQIGEPWTQRYGQEWIWYPLPEKKGDTRLAPRETRSYDIPWPQGVNKAVVISSSHRMSKETAEYHHLEDYPISVETERLEVQRPTPK